MSTESAQMPFGFYVFMFQCLAVQKEQVKPEVNSYS